MSKNSLKGQLLFNKKTCDKTLKKWAKKSDFCLKLNMGAAFGCLNLAHNR